MTALTMVDLLVRGAGISSCLFFCAILLSQGLRKQTIWRGILYAICVAAFLIWSAHWFDQIQTEFGSVILALTLFNPLLFWLASRALFNDGQAFSSTEAIVCAGFFVLVLALVVLRNTNAGAAQDTVTTAYRLSALVIVIIALGEMVRGFGDDLLEPRRRLRIYLFAILGAYFIVLFVARILFPDGQAALWASTINALLVTLLVMANNYVCVRFREELLPSPTHPVTFGESSESTIPMESVLATSVVEAMENDQLYRDPKLSISALSDRLGVQEYRLRRTINKELGYRNFSQFLNSFRLREAREALSDPSRYHQSILTLAYESGFNSIGPFNRAFKDAFGTTPSEFRRSRREDA